MKKLLGIVVLGLLMSGNAYAKKPYFECIHSDKSKDYFLYNYDEDKFYVYEKSYELFHKMDIVNFINNIIYAERYVPNLALGKMTRYSSIEFNILTYEMTKKNYGYDIEEKVDLRFELKCNKFFKID